MGDMSVVTTGGGYQLGEVTVDGERFEELVRLGRAEAGSLSAISHWSAALNLWTGRAFEGYEDLPSVGPTARRLEELRAEVTGAWLEARFSAGERSELVADVTEAVGRFPLREELRRQQMLLLSTMGRQADALRAFQNFRDQMLELGLEPSAELVELDQQIATGTLSAPNLDVRIRGYQIGKELGRGQFSVVYQARQTSVDRDVAIKVIRSELADRPEFIAQFESEAQLVARLEHPNILPLYDYWREPGAAFLVMRLMHAGSLAEAIHDGPLPSRRVTEIIIDVAAAASDAHHRDIVHRDIKPANILLDERGRAHLSDFGIAVDLNHQVDRRSSTHNGWHSAVGLTDRFVTYAAPELLSGGPIDQRTDVYALGITAFEALVGEVPYPGETSVEQLYQRQLNDPLPLARVLRPDLPAGVDTVLQRATAKSPEDRYETAGEFAEALAAAVGMPGAALPAPEGRNPYKGLLSFTEADAADFVGRERLTGRLVESVEKHRLTMVVGASGSGKSSLVAAGMVPRLRLGREGTPPWLITQMTPGADPFAAWTEAIRQIAVEAPDDMTRRLRADPGASRSAHRGLANTRGRSLVVIDQFEELYTLADIEDQERFVEMLLAVAADTSIPVHTVAVLRADFFHRPLASAGLTEAIEQSTIAVHPLTPDELERAIVEPTAAVGASFELGLVARLLADVADQPGALPLLQHVLAELFEHREDEILLISSYDKLGGVAGSLGRRAEDTYASLSPDEQAAARSVFGKLVAIGDATVATRRRAVQTELVAAGETTASAAAGVVIERFGRARLLSFDNDPASRQATVELAHESLLTGWGRLADWLHDDRDRLRTQHLLSQAAEYWNRQGRHDADLYRGARLSATLDAIESDSAGSTAVGIVERHFLDRSIERSSSPSRPFSSSDYRRAAPAP